MIGGLLRRFSAIFTAWCLPPHVVSSPGEHAIPTDFPLKNRLQQKGWREIPGLHYKNLWLSPAHLPVSPSSLNHIDEASCHVVRCPTDVSTWQEETSKGLKSSVKPPTRKRILLVTLWISLEAYPHIWVLRSLESWLTHWLWEARWLLLSRI